ncbi:unnamed protein product [Angiostrongylus costaricensis]|uniref:Sulfate_transp domain-containing protein n=1 Tax=Angiostrongylus costaricensis TaxID=334426 RepID=A0A0R3PAQ2_ANGCS|nr:unnamed protein product [Angiostrongylus costaricensis]
MVVNFPPIYKVCDCPWSCRPGADFGQADHAISGNRNGLTSKSPKYGHYAGAQTSTEHGPFKNQASIELCLRRKGLEESVALVVFVTAFMNVYAEHKAASFALTAGTVAL